MHAYQEAIHTTILRLAEGYRHRPVRDIDQPRRKADATGKALSKGEAIRARIAANARKRFAIGEAMKAEAGVREHRLTGESNGGIAWTDRAQILAPAGENIVQLATLAHECGHVFLHSVGTEGSLLAGHVKEMEAESYAHQAFKAHGMRMPPRITAWGRDYVASWCRHDHAAGIPLDPRAVAYALGSRSPFEPLRYVPESWRAAGIVSLADLEHRDAARPASPPPAVALSTKRRPSNGPCGRWRWMQRLIARAWARRHPLRPTMLEELVELLVYLGKSAAFGLWAGFLAVQCGGAWGCPPIFCNTDKWASDLSHWPNAVAAAAIWTCLAMLWRDATRKPR
ncbi:MAG: hypothetical protein AB7O57_07430 [Hyphomicrobiaceae bacterium]